MDPRVDYESTRTRSKAIGRDRAPCTSMKIARALLLVEVRLERFSLEISVAGGVVVVLQDPREVLCHLGQWFPVEVDLVEKALPFDLNLHGTTHLAYPAEAAGDLYRRLRRSCSREKGGAYFLPIHVRSVE